jgi:hypothetical protein
MARNVINIGDVNEEVVDENDELSMNKNDSTISTKLKVIFKNRRLISCLVVIEVFINYRHTLEYMHICPVSQRKKEIFYFRCWCSMLITCHLFPFFSI